MKTNLSSIYETNKSIEKDGKWFELTKEVSFKLKRMGGANSGRLAEIRAMHFKPYARQIKNDTLDKAIQEKLFIKVFVDGCLVDWKGLVDDDGIKIEYTKETAIELLLGSSDLFDELIAMADDMSSFKEDAEDLGKS